MFNITRFANNAMLLAKKIDVTNAIRSSIAEHNFSLKNINTDERFEDFLGLFSTIDFVLIITEHLVPCLLDNRGVIAEHRTIIIELLQDIQSGITDSVKNWQQLEQYARTTPLVAFTASIGEQWQTLQTLLERSLNSIQSIEGSVLAANVQSLLDKNSIGQVIATTVNQLQKQLRKKQEQNFLDLFKQVFATMNQEVEQSLMQYQELKKLETRWHTLEAPAAAAEWDAKVQRVTAKHQVQQMQLQIVNTGEDLQRKLAVHKSVLDATTQAMEEALKPTEGEKFLGMVDDFQAVQEATVSIFDAIATGMAGGSMLGPAGTIAGAGIALFQHFSRQQDTTVERSKILSQQIQAVAGMVVTLSEHMDMRINILSNQIDTGFDHIDQRLERVEQLGEQLYREMLTQFRAVHRDIGQLQQAAFTLINRMDQLTQIIDKRFAEQLLAPFYRKRQEAFAVARELTVVNVKRFLALFVHTATEEASSETVAGRKIMDSDIALLNAIQQAGIEGSMNSLAAHAEHTSRVRIPARIVNPLVWARAAQAYMSLLYQASQLPFQDSSIQPQLATLLQAGEALQTFVQTARESSWLAVAINTYRKALQMVLRQIEVTCWPTAETQSAFQQELAEFYLQRNQEPLAVDAKSLSQQTSAAVAEKTMPLSVEKTFNGACNDVKGRAHSFFVLPDERLLYFTSEMISLLNIRTGHCEIIFNSGGCVGGWLGSPILLPDGRLAFGVGLSQDYSIRVLNINSKRIEVTLPHTEQIVAFAVLSTGQLASADEGRSETNKHFIRLWNIKTGQCEHTVKTQSTITTLVSLPDGRLASTSVDGTIQLWAPTLRCTATIPGCTKYQGIILILLPDGRLATMAEERTIKLLNLSNNTFEMTLKGHLSDLSHLTLLPDGRLASIAVGDGTDTIIKIWDVKSGSCNATFMHPSTWVSVFIWLADGRLAISDDDNNLVLCSSAQFSYKEKKEPLVTALKAYRQQYAKPIEALPLDRLTEYSRQPQTMQRWHAMLTESLGSRATTTTWTQVLTDLEAAKGILNAVINVLFNTAVRNDLCLRQLLQVTLFGRMDYETRLKLSISKTSEFIYLTLRIILEQQLAKLEETLILHTLEMRETKNLTTLPLIDCTLHQLQILQTLVNPVSMQSSELATPTVQANEDFKELISLLASEDYRFKVEAKPGLIILSCVAAKQGDRFFERHLRDLKSNLEQELTHTFSASTYQTTREGNSLQVNFNDLSKTEQVLQILTAAAGTAWKPAQSGKTNFFAVQAPGVPQPAPRPRPLQEIAQCTIL